MVPFGLTQEQFISRYRKFLELASSKFISQLREVLKTPVPDSVTSAEVQIFFGDDGLSTPNAWIYFDGKNKKIDHKDQSIFPGRALDLALQVEGADDFDERYFTDETFGGLSIVANTVKSWFAECWWKAGGWSYPIKVEVWIHDGFGDGKSIILTENR